ncbi:MAG: hypothetical protein CVT48_01795 [Thermoplasmata archaeon HGW-Thermoplasmata-1]|nr:MAG: hypothetical protein CVT48_01795 [Thermoplasmata archaeon HGW-Thermoplasmata-1]
MNTRKGNWWKKALAVTGITLAVLIAFPFVSLGVHFAEMKINEANGDGVRIIVPYSKLGDVAGYSLSFQNHTYTEPLYKKEWYTIEVDNFGERIEENAFGVREKIVSINESFNYTVKSEDTVTPEIFEKTWHGKTNVIEKSTRYYLNESCNLANYDERYVRDSGSGSEWYTESDARMVDYGYGAWNWYPSAMWYQGGSIVLDITYRSYAAWEGTEVKIINGQKCVSLEEERTFTVGNAPDGDRSFETYAVNSSRGEVFVKEITKTWWSSESPYFVLREVFATVTGQDDSVIDEIATRLVLSYSPGGEAVPWADGRLRFWSLGEGMQNSMFDWEKSSVHGIPQDGKDCELDYTLNQAFESVLADPDMSLQKYLRDNPDAYLQGAYYKELFPTTEDDFSALCYFSSIPLRNKTCSWLMIFSDGAYSDKGYLCYSNKTIPLGESAKLTISIPDEVKRTENSEISSCGVIMLPAPERFEEMPTLSSAIRAWKERGDPKYTSNCANMFSFGVDGFSRYRNYDFYNANYTDSQREQIHHEIKVGYTNFYGDYWNSGLPPTEIPPRYGYEIEDSTLRFNCSNGRLMRLWEYTSNSYYPFGWPLLSVDDSGFSYENSGASDNSGSSLSYGSSAPPWFSLSVQSIEKTAIGFSAAGFLALVAYLLPSIKYGFAKVFIVPLYCRKHKGGVLDHGIRARMLELVGKEGGLNITALRKNLGIGWGETVYHLDVLQREGYLLSIKHGRSRRFFVSGEKDYWKQQQDAVLKEATSRYIYDFIMRNPGAIQRSVADHMGISHPAVNWHVGRLKSVDLVSEKRDGRTIRYFANGLDSRNS